MANNRYTTFCFRCYHTWKRRKEKLPKVCPRCKSPYWGKPRKRAVKGIILKIKEDIIQIHNAIINLSGGVMGVREEGGIYNSVYKLLNYQYKHRKDPVGLGAFILNEFARGIISRMETKEQHMLSQRFLCWLIDVILRWNIQKQCLLSCKWPSMTAI